MRAPGEDEEEVVSLAREIYIQIIAMRQTNRAKNNSDSLDASDMRRVRRLCILAARTFLEGEDE